MQPGQSLNFSNLLVYYESQWDERVAPFFRMRVIEVTKERNEETRRMLERANSLARSVGTVAGNPNILPVAGIAVAAANLVLANKENRAILDYTVQLYSQKAVSQAGSSALGKMRRGSYIVIGKPKEEPKSFWIRAKDFVYETQARSLYDRNTVVNVPTALFSVGTFDSIVPKIVLERSKALTALLAANGKDASIEQMNLAADQLNASVAAFALAEKLTRYNDRNHADLALAELQNDKMKKFLSDEDKYNVLRAVSKCFGSNAVMTEQQAWDYKATHPGVKCKD